MVKVFIDNVEVEVEAGSTVFQACQKAATEVPHFCYHEKLAIAGNCRMCLVEVENAPKPVASCAFPVADGMKVITKSEKVEKARKGVMEFLLINHPLDCPICDQGGECDLQDEAMAYGFDRSRFEENKRAVKDKDLGPLVKTEMTRCIHCTRCVRFMTDVAGVEELGAAGRGEHMEIMPYIEKSFTSELSGNIIDLCPVGALTSKPYAFTARSWELKHTPSIDVHDALGSHIRIDSKGPEVMRILPRANDAINEEWLSDKARFSYDGLKMQRLDRPYVRVKGQLKPASWDEAFKVVAEKMKETQPEAMMAFAGDLADAESMFLLKNLFDTLGSKNYDCREDGALYSTKERAHYLFNTTLEGMEEADVCLLIGTDLRFEAPLLNARLRKMVLGGGHVGLLSAEDQDLTYKHDYLGADLNELETILSGKHAFSKVLKAAKKPMLILGHDVLTRSDSLAVQAKAFEIAQKYKMLQKDFNGYNVLHRAASRVAALDLGFVPSKKVDMKKIELLYALNADELPEDVLENTFVIYQGHHGDRGANHADVILPGAAYTEKTSIFTNTEGRVQKTHAAMMPKGEAREDWKIFIALSKALGHEVPFITRDDVEAAMIEKHPVFGVQNTISPVFDMKPIADKKAISDKPLKVEKRSFYQTDVISKASVIMARCRYEIEGHKACNLKGGAAHG